MHDDVDHGPDERQAEEIVKEQQRKEQHGTALPPTLKIDVGKGHADASASL
jgi:hypothetical protein